MTPKYNPICDDPQKIFHRIFIPQKISISLKTPQNIEIQNFEPKKMTRAYVCMKISEYPPTPPQAITVTWMDYFVNQIICTGAVYYGGVWKPLPSRAAECRPT